MSRYDGSEGPDPAQPYVAAFQAWDASIRDRARIENDLAMAYVDLLGRYREKVAECEREKRSGNSSRCITNLLTSLVGMP
jgi:hypothetical protein